MRYGKTVLVGIIVEPPNKGHVGDNINSAVVSFVERLSSFGGLKANFWDLELCPL